MRAAPDVILIGEIRDRESMEYALTFAGTGHLCLATLHANNAAETLDRIINMFPRDQHSQIFLDLSQYLKAILSQRLVMGKDGKRCAALEVLLNTPHVQELIKKGDVIGVKESLIRSSEKGVQSFDIALYELYKQGKVTLEEAISNADSRTNLEAIFGIPGVGRISVNAIQSRDMPLLQGSVLFATVLVILGNLVADILYSVLDPRIRSQMKGGAA